MYAHNYVSDTGIILAGAAGHHAFIDARCSTPTKAQNVFDSTRMRFSHQVRWCHLVRSKTLAERLFSRSFCSSKKNRTCTLEISETSVSHRIERSKNLMTLAQRVNHCSPHCVPQRFVLVGTRNFSIRSLEFSDDGFVTQTLWYVTRTNDTNLLQLFDTMYATTQQRARTRAEC